MAATAKSLPGSLDHSLPLPSPTYASSGGTRNFFSFYLGNISSPNQHVVGGSGVYLKI
jgi:hypothetical protein